MGVYIKGMEMPENGWKHILLTSDGKAYLFEAFSADNTATRYEAVEVPPHGRLGDLDKLEQMFVDIDNAPYSVFDGEESFYSAEDAAQIIRLAPTVIPASEVAPDINAAHKTMEETPEIQHVGYDDAQLGREK